MEGSLDGQAVQLLVDTGASVNLISLRWWRTKGGGQPLRDSAVEIYSVDGRPMDLRGEVSGNLRLGQKEVPASFIVAEMGNEAILGAPFLRDHGMMVDVANERVLWTTSPPAAETGAACRVVSARSAVVGGGQETFVEGVIMGSWPRGKEGLIEPLVEGKGSPGFLVGRGLVTPDDDRALVRVLNPGKRTPGHLQKHVLSLH